MRVFHFLFFFGELGVFRGDAHVTERRFSALISGDGAQQKWQSKGFIVSHFGGKVDERRTDMTGETSPG